MASSTEKIYRSFVKGIITESSALTYPENASIDEDNFTLQRTGDRRRRLGVDYEAYNTLTSSGLTTTQIKEGRQSFHQWDSPGGDTTVSLGVVRIYNRLWFLNLLATSPSSDLKNSGTYITITGLNSSDLETTVINNELVLVSKDLTVPIRLSYNISTGAVTQTQIPIYVRDIWGVDDGLTNNERPTSLSNLHKYNLRNQGWSTKIVTSTGADAIAKTFTDLGLYPSNSDIWTLGKDSNSASADYEKYVPSVLLKNSVSNSLVSRGSYVIDAFDRGDQRATLSGLSGLPIDQEIGNITTIASYAGRLFYSGISSRVTSPDSKSPNYSGYVLFSQTVTDNQKLGKCHQETDPTDETFNDVLPTDGGTLQIPEATRIVKIVASKSSLIIFAENGIWELYGDTGGFIATSYQVSKIASNGVLNASSIVETNGTFIYWSKSGIFSLTNEPVSGRFQAQNISLVTIQELFLNIPDLAKNNCRGFYDERENRVRWLYNDTDTYSETNYINSYNRELVLDLTLQAFYTYTIESLDTGSPYISSYIDIPGQSVASQDIEVAVGADIVLVTAGDTVIVRQGTNAGRISQFSFLTIVGTSFTISKYNNTSFTDWEVAGLGTGKSFLSYLVTGYELFGDLLKEKQVPYIQFYFKRTEDGFELDGANVVLKNQSSCLVQAQWNWTDSANSGKWGNQFQAYKLLRNYIPTGVSDPFDYGESLIVTKNKLRGKGKALSLKLESETGKDMHILGWGISVTADSK